MTDYKGEDAVFDAISELHHRAHLLTGIRSSTRVYTDMVADLFHAGHVNYLRQCKFLGARPNVELVVGIHSDETTQSYKRRPVCSMKERICCVAACSYVDEVVADAPLIVDEEYLATHRVDVVVAATGSASRLQWNAVPITKGIYTEVPRTPNIDTTRIIARILGRADELAAGTTSDS